MYWNSEASSIISWERSFLKKEFLYEVIKGYDKFAGVITVTKSFT